MIMSSRRAKKQKADKKAAQVKKSLPELKESEPKKQPAKKGK